MTTQTPFYWFGTQAPGAPRTPARRLGTRGISYVSLICGMVITLVAAVMLSDGLIQGLRLSRMLRIQTQLWDAAQDEMERLRSLSFEELESQPIERPGMSGEVRVEPLTVRRKRVTVLLRHAGTPMAPVVVVTLVHQKGMPR